MHILCCNCIIAAISLRASENTNQSCQSDNDFAKQESPSQENEHSLVSTYSCWICQEEFSAQAPLLEHYDNHMR